ncbi:MAG: glycosyltransferase family 4 protein [Methanomicrobiaceae archaeon]|uniref:Glycosyl hydrolase domain protein n=1 Tax=hydrocarbon metagenome TaxID=938273 RepID=A0A0W8FJT6_9ZZZZ|nr:glycosyltransferase family 4 protein [Methanomicrobiaceae archaeon]MDD5419165.1 glycosyltransferase family 4 protein [Methanomicrobiaceae archaeon]
MKICIIGDFSGNHDEGFKNTAVQLAGQLSGHHQVLRLDVEGIASPRFWHGIRQFQPEIIHYITAPTALSFLVLQCAARFCRNGTKLVASSLSPLCYAELENPVFRACMSRTRPDIVLTHSNIADAALREIGCRTHLLPNGVDMGRFRPVSDRERQRLRARCGLDDGRFILLHVGHVNRHRGLEVFLEIQARIPDCHAVIVGSTHFATDHHLAAALRKQGCTVWNGYCDHIEDIFQMADCYLFPQAQTLFLPLTVLEAMACNLPVVSYRHEGLSTFFEEGGGLTLCDADDDYLEHIRRVMQGKVVPRTREKAAACSWERISKELCGIYAAILEEG